MTDVRNVFITSEVAEKLGMNPSYLIKLGKKIGLDQTEMREAGKRNYLFSKDAIKKISQATTKDQI